jgi:Transposase
MHVVMSANRCPDKTRRRVQNEQLAHRGRAHEPLYGVRKLLMIAAEKLAPRLKKRFDVMLAFGDPKGEVYEAWMFKELVRDIYTLYGKPEEATHWVDSLIDRDRNPWPRTRSQTVARTNFGLAHNRCIKRSSRRTELHHQEIETGRRRFPTIRPLPHTHPARHRRRQLEPPPPRPIMKSR